MGQTDISWLNLGLGSLIVIIPLLIFLYYKTGLVKDSLIAFGRMTLQLFLVGFYLEFIFELNSIWINLAWVLVMINAAAFMVVRRSDLRQKYFYLPITFAVVANVIINGAVFTFIIVGADNIFGARYLIPIMGMVIGNTLNSSIIGLRSFFNFLKKDEQLYKFYLMCGATREEALFGFTGRALKEAFNPVIASTAVIGLIWLPGMMTGQILGGSDPMLAIKYQIIIVLAIFAGSVITVFTALYISRIIAFNKFELLRKEAVKYK
jgi:putative ABC transport system permease protein